MPEPVTEDESAMGDKAPMNGPPLSGKGISQADINAHFD